MGEGEGGGECPNRVPPHLYPLPPRGEEVFCGVIFYSILVLVLGRLLEYFSLRELNRMISVHRKYDLLFPYFASYDSLFLKVFQMSNGLPSGEPFLGDGE